MTFAHWLFGMNVFPVIWPPLCCQGPMVMVAGTQLTCDGGGQTYRAAAAGIDRLADITAPASNAVKSFAVMTLLSFPELRGEGKRFELLVKRPTGSPHRVLASEPSDATER
jgi:hypothetical protein